MGVLDFIETQKRFRDGLVRPNGDDKGRAAGLTKKNEYRNE